VIKNERQYRITKAQAEKFRATLDELAAMPRPKNVHPKLWEAQKAGLKSQLQDLEAELQEYETLKTGGRKILELDSLEGLPKMLIQARVAAGLTQEDLAARLGVKPQQIQRYEASDYQTASFARLREIALATSRCSRQNRDARSNRIANGNSQRSPGPPGFTSFTSLTGSMKTDR
jgi:DNA-binding transcriptional regulator YiaG